MKDRSVRFIFTLLVPFFVLLAQVAFGSVPGSMEITCDVDRRAFRTAAKNQTQVTFRLWDAETGGSQCGPDYVVPTSDLVGFKSFTDIFDSLVKRRALRLQALLGSDASPVQLCSGNQTWVDVSVGLQTFTCDFSSQSALARKRLHSVPFAQPADISARVRNSADISIANNVTTVLTFDTELWDTDNIHSAVMNASCLTATTPGKYLIFGHVNFDTSATGHRLIGIRLNAVRNLAQASVGTSDNTQPVLSIATHYDLSANDCVELYVHQDSGGSLNVLSSPDSSAEFGMVKLP